MSRIAVLLALLLLAGCSCCDSTFQVRRYAIDDATAMRAPGPYDCVDLCNTLGFGPTDANSPDADTSPLLARASRCTLDPATTGWTLTCDYGRGCPR